MSTKVREEVLRRRTFAIISHPDAGKTTMTEKLLLYGGAIHEAGSVRARKTGQHATSDWMDIEKERGISVTSSVMQFEYEGFCINILDTPGHQDFSEDTYRTLMAADAAVMLIDGGRGVEEQTIKLFEVCRMRGIPIFTFVNKMDRVARPPFELMDEIEKVLGIRSVPMNWPIGIYGDFKGVYNRFSQKVELFDRSSSDHGMSRVSYEASDLEDPKLAEMIGEDYQTELLTDIELLDMAGEDFDREKIDEGQLTPLYFGSALTNFGVETFLRSFLEMAPSPASYESNQGKIPADSEDFSGFIFKIQANMDPRHRDRMAFLRICSGAYQKDMGVTLARTGKQIRLAQPQQFLAQDHASVEQAYAGDIIGLFDPGIYRLGDSLSTGSFADGSMLEFNDIPSFPPEHFARVYAKNSLKRKQFLQGLEQLSQEGTIQLYKEPSIGTETFCIGVVGMLQFDVLEHRLKEEYKVDLRREPSPYRLARWVHFNAKASQTDPTKLVLPSQSLLVEDRDGKPVVLFASPWNVDWVLERNEGLELHGINT